MPDSTPVIASKKESPLKRYLQAFNLLVERQSLLLPSAILIVGLALSAWIYLALKSNETKLDEAQFHDLINDAEQAVQERLRAYVDALQSAAAYRLNSDHVTREEWRKYVDYVDLPNRYPGINGLGYIDPFFGDELAAYVNQVRANELADFSIKNVPNVTRPQADEMGYPHYIITYIEPIENNRAALGLDTGSEANRQAAGQKARDTGKAAMTGRITLVQDGQARPGFLIYYPMYAKRDKSLVSVEDRRKAFLGWSYAPFVTENFLAGVLGTRADQISFEIYDNVKIDPAYFVYATHRSNTSSDPKDFVSVSQLNLAGQTFSFGWNHGPNFKKQGTHSSIVAGSSLALGTFLLALLVLNLENTTRRANAIVKVKTSELLKTNDTLVKEVYLRKQAKKAADEAKAVAEEANSAKSEFLAVMSHEIRTPMNSVLGFSELLSNSNLDNEQRQWVSYIESSGKSLLHIINDILDFSKIEANKLELEATPFSLNKAVKEIAYSFNILAGQKGIVINYKCAEEIPSAVIGDPIRLKQIVSNLIANALKFTNKGSINVSISWKDLESNGEATIKVTDTGIGIPANKVNSLFDKFTQVDSSTTRKFGGTGLGLAICMRLTKMMDGQIHAESVEGAGTTIITTLPFHKTTNAPTLTRSPFNTAKPEVDTKELNVLLVDDNKMNQHLGATLLRRMNCKVTLADNGADAIELLKSQRFHLVFLDCQMPVMDGFETTKRIRQFEASNQFPSLPADAPLKIVALTADVSPKTKEACIAIGMDDYLSKPIRKNDLHAVLEAYRQT